MPVSQNPNNHIFALDIGTRTVIGIVGYMEEDNLKIIAQEIIEHEGRSMFDGQIHDIPKVAGVVSAIKKRLEQNTDLVLDKVAVAAAGRSLKTINCHTETEHDKNREIDILDIRNLELNALHRAHQELGENNVEDYYCVGHCVVNYLLDDLPLSNLLGHKADKIGVEIVATFLPVSVVNSLYAVLNRVDLEPINLTLEPIAAIDVAIPTNYRLLNLALVDIGAGTSDIAITRNGSIIAYGMVPMAGDELTEPIVEKLLVEFKEAEKIKRLFCTEDEISFTDIIGITSRISREELNTQINPALDKLADAISANILKLNGGTPPKSVFCIGGGAQIPALTEKLAERLQLDCQRVVIRDRSFLNNLICPDDFLAGPEGVTVVGIATVALTKLGYEFMTVRINGNDYKLFNSRNINVSQALGLIKFDPRQLLAKNGNDLKFVLNGKEHTIFGELGQKARILLNNREANLQTTVQDGHEIIVIKAINGQDASAKVEDFLLEKTDLLFRLNGSDIQWQMHFLLNGKKVASTTPLNPGDNLVISTNPTLKEVALRYGIDLTLKDITINGQKALTQDVIQTGDTIEITANKKPHTDTCFTSKASANETQIQGINLTVNSDQITLPQKKAIFVDIFNFFEIDTSKPKGVLVMKINGTKAQYTDPIFEGDHIEIFWKEA